MAQVLALQAEVIEPSERGRIPSRTVYMQFALAVTTMVMSRTPCRHDPPSMKYVVTGRSNMHLAGSKVSGQSVCRFMMFECPEWGVCSMGRVWFSQTDDDRSLQSILG